MSFAPPLADSQAFCQNRAEVCALGGERPEGLLDVWQPRLVLDVEQGTALAVPSHEVRATCELEVLIRFVEGEFEAVTAENPSLKFTHRGVDKVLIVALGRGARSVAGEVHIQLHSKGMRDPRVAVEARCTPGLDRVYGSGGQPGSVAEFAKRPAMADALLVDRHAKLHSDAGDGRNGAGCGAGARASRAHVAAMTPGVARVRGRVGLTSRP